MPLRKDNSEFLMREFQARQLGGIGFLVARGAEKYREEVTEVIHPESPAGNPTQPYFAPPHSFPGEFPDAETLQGAENIDSEIFPETNSGAFGVRGEATGTGPKPPTHSVPGGAHLIYLMDSGRLGPDAVVELHRAELAAEFENGFRAV